MGAFRKIILFGVFGAIFIACKKEEIPPSTVIGAPVFSFNGTIGGNTLNWQAGVNNYYLYSSFTQDSGVYRFIGALRSTANSLNSIQISVNDYKYSATNASVASHIDSSFSQSSYYYLPGSDTMGYSITFTPRVYYGSPVSYSWNFGDGNTSTAISPTHTYIMAGNYKTSLSVTFLHDSTVTMANPITIFRNQPQLWIDSVHYTVDTLTFNTTKVNFTARVHGGGTPYLYTWFYGDGSDSVGFAFSAYTANHTYSGNTGKAYAVNLKVIDHLGQSETYNYVVWDRNSNYTKGLIDYKMTAPVPGVSFNSFSNIAITYTDGSGNIYTSKNPLQPGSSKFQILSVSNYQNNANNNPTKMLKVAFNCMLYNGNNSIPANGTANIAVAYQ